MILLPYQRSAWALTVAHRVTIWIAARQIGKTTTVALWAFEKALRGQSVVILSASLQSCAELMRRVREIVWVFYPGLQTAGLRVRLPTGGQIVGVASNPRTARGWSAHLVLDEADFSSDPRGVWRAAYPITTRGYRVFVVSSPLCEGSWCHEMVLGARRRGYGVQTTTIYDAVEGGLAVDVDALRDGLDDGDAWGPEYECDFTASRLIYFPIERVTAAQAEDLPAVGEAYGGVDIGRTTDLTVLSVVRRMGRRYVMAEAQEVLENVRYEAQVDVIAGWARRHGVRMITIDGRGVGAPVAEMLETRLPGRVDTIRGDGTRWNEDLCGRVRVLLDRGLLRIPYDRDLVRDFRSIRRSQDGALETVRSRRGGHGDRYWSLAYAIHAAREWGPPEIDVPTAPAAPRGPVRRRIYA